MTYVAVNKAIKMFHLEDVTVLDNTINNYFSQDTLFGNELGDGKFNFGFGITPFQSGGFKVEDFHDYGSLKLYYEKWDSTQDVFVPIKTKLCDKHIFPKPSQEKKDSHIKEMSKMFPINESKKDELDSLLGHSLICNDEDLSI